MVIQSNEKMTFWRNCSFCRDERLGLFVRLYAIVESSVQKISAEMLIEQIRAEILPFDRTYGEHPVNNIGNDAQVRNLPEIIRTG